MPDLIDMINFAIVIAGITISVLGLVLSFRVRFLDTWIRRFFICIFAVILAYTVSDLISQISLVFLGPEYSILSTLAVFLESLFSSVLMPMLTVYFLHQSGNKLRCTLLYIVYFLWTVYAALLVFTQFTDIIYYISDENIYQRGPFYPLLLIPPVLLMLCNIIGLYHRRALLSPREGRAFWLYFIITVVSMLIQMTAYGILSIMLGTSISALIMFILILSDQTDKTLKQAIKISEQQLRIRTLQIRPHFIYNTMTNIYYLCDMDPKKAQSVVGDFTSYLRKNFSSVEKQGLIPFSDEMEHTRAFLAVVKARYEELLFTEYDTPHTAFLVPPLTLEPIVENAVKHGLDQESSPLHIWIRTRLIDDGAEIIVENSGAELSLQDSEWMSGGSDNDDPHIGLNNVSDRLRALCGGSITISPREGGGAVVIMHIPYEHQKPTVSSSMVPQ